MNNLSQNLYFYEGLLTLKTCFLKFLNGQQLLPPEALDRRICEPPYSGTIVAPLRSRGDLCITPHTSKGGGSLVAPTLSDSSPSPRSQFLVKTGLAC